MLARLRIALLCLGSVLAAGVLGYMVVEGWSPLDAAYMTIITIATVGFREVHPLSQGGQILTMGLIVAGVAALGFSLGTVIDFMVEGHFSGLVEGRRMEKRIASMTGHHVVAGLGRVGSTVAREFSARGVPFVVIDRSEEALARAKEAGWAYVQGDATEETVLAEAGIAGAVSLVTALDTDAENLFVTLTARGMKADLYIVARSSARSAEGKLLNSGADRVLTPSEIGGRRMAAMVLQPGIADYLDIVMRSESVELKLEQIMLSEGDPFVGKSLREGSVRSRTGVHVLAVQHSDGSYDPDPGADTLMEAGDRLVAIGTEEQFKALAGWACVSPEVCYIPTRTKGKED